MRRLPQYVVISRKALLLPRRGCRLALLQLLLLGASRCVRLLAVFEWILVLEGLYASEKGKGSPWW